MLVLAFDLFGFSLSVLLWWLELFIEALVLSPNIEREGRQQLAILKGNIWYTYPY